MYNKLRRLSSAINGVYTGADSLWPMYMVPNAFDQNSAQYALLPAGDLGEAVYY